MLQQFFTHSFIAQTSASVCCNGALHAPMPQFDVAMLPYSHASLLPMILPAAHTLHVKKIRHRLREHAFQT